MITVCGSPTLLGRHGSENSAPKAENPAGMEKI